MPSTSSLNLALAYGALLTPSEKAEFVSKRIRALRKREQILRDLIDSVEVYDLVKAMGADDGERHGW